MPHLELRTHAVLVDLVCKCNPVLTLWCPSEDENATSTLARTLDAQIQVICLCNGGGQQKVHICA